MLSAALWVSAVMPVAMRTRNAANALALTFLTSTPTPEQAEKLNGRACMVGYFLALVVDKLTGAGLADQQGSFLGLLSLHIVVFGVLLFPTVDRIQVRIATCIDESLSIDG